MSSVLKILDITKKFPRHPSGSILNGISLELFTKTSVAITGNSGNGKSTLLQIMGLLDAPDSGKILFGNKLVSPQKRAFIRNRHFGFIFQNFHLIEDESIIKNVLMPGFIARQNVSKGSLFFKRACDLLRYVGIHSDMYMFPTRFLSGGEKQRVAIARALVNSPSVIFADEPSGNLDSQNSQVVYDLLLDAVSGGAALIMVTHDLQAADLCCKTFVLKDGKLV